MESVRLAARRRFSLACSFLAGGAVLLALAKPLLAGLQVGFVTGLILSTLLIVLGLSEGAYTASALGRAFPLSELAAAARGDLLMSLVLVLPLAIVAAAGWIFLALPGTPAVLIPSVPFFWAPVGATASLGLLAAARELASERMTVLAAVGAGFVFAAAAFSAAWSLVDARGVLEDPLFSAQLLLVGLGFFLLAIAFSQDAWIARVGRRP